MPISANTQREQEKPVCLNCLHPVDPSDYVCGNCGEAVGQLTPYLPYEGIRYYAGMWGKLWHRLWYDDRDGILLKFFYLSLVVVMGSPVLLLLMPLVLWQKARGWSGYKS